MVEDQQRGENGRGTLAQDAPSPDGSNGGHDAQGRFTKGNPGGQGNPYARRVARLRSIILDAVSDDDLRAVVAALVNKAKEGDVVAARELFNRLVGKPPEVLDPDSDKAEMDELRLDLRERLLELVEERQHRKQLKEL